MTTVGAGGESGLAQFIPARLKEARKARGKNMSQLADKIGVTRQAISRYELGQAKPSAEVMERLARTLDVPLGYFTTPFLDSPPVGPEFFRSFASATAAQRELCSSRRDWLTKLILPPLERIFDLPAPKLPHLEPIFSIGQPLNVDEIESAAQECRRAFGIGNGPISHLVRLLESHGVLIARIALGNEKIDAFSCWYGARPVIILSSDKASAVRSRFDAAHELAHLLLHQGVTEEQLSNKQILKVIESDAQRFASAFLLPASTFSGEVMSTRLEHLQQLKIRWGASMQAIVYRCSELGIFDEAQTLSVRKLIGIRGYRLKEPLDDQIPIEEPSVLSRAIEMLVESGMRQPEDLEVEFRLKPSDIETLCALAPGRLDALRKSNVITLRLRQP